MLPLPVPGRWPRALEKAAGVTAGVKIVIRLGYLDDPRLPRAVLTGRVESIESADQVPAARSLLTGHEEASFLLLNTVESTGRRPEPTLAASSLSEHSPAGVAQLIVSKSGAKMTSGKRPDPGSPAGQPRDSIAEEAEDAFHLLDKIAARFGAEVLVQEGKVMFGPALQYPPRDRRPVPPIPTRPPSWR